MWVVKPPTVHRYMARHPTARASLLRWLDVISQAEWRTIADVRQVFPHADTVTVASGKPVVVFNIGGNHFRLIVAIHYDKQRAYVREFMTHAEYSRDAWKGRH